MTMTPPTDDPHVIAEEVRTTRRSRGMTQEQLAATAGVSLRTVRNIEAGKGGRPAMLGAVWQALFGEPTPEYPDDVAAIVNMVGYRLLALPVERRADLAGQLVRLIMNHAAEADTPEQAGSQ